MNLYFVLSEWLVERVIIDRELGGPMEEYRIAELVVVKNRSQAKYLAWRADRCRCHCPHDDIRDMPKMQTRLKGKKIPGPARIVSSETVMNAFPGAWDL